MMWGSKTDLQQYVLDLWRPVEARLSPGGAQATLGASGAMFSSVAAGLEGFSRPLWGLLPLVAGGGQIDWSLIHQGLAHGSDPDHPEFWGWPDDAPQLLVEMAPIGLALALLPEHVWDPLTPEVKARLTHWLGRINSGGLPDSNWLFFRVLVNLGLRRVEAGEYQPDAETAALDRLESFYLGEGWYQDGPSGRCDYYVPWAFHFYGLIYARLAGDRDPERAARFCERATLFARQFIHWFDTDGRAVPYGRSLTYRYAQAGFWSALAFADVEALPWGQIKGLLLRHLRWWRGAPITDNGDVLTIGYSYPNLVMAEQYNSPGSLYWAMKVFLVLATRADHPLWRSPEEPMPQRAEVAKQTRPRMLLCHGSDHTFALAGGQDGVRFRTGSEKYAKFAYSSVFGFSVPTSARTLADMAPDSTLVLSEDEAHWRGRDASTEVEVVDGAIWSRWEPWPDVAVDTWLAPRLPWHVRVHRILTRRPLWTAEGGWAADLGTAGNIAVREGSDVGSGYAAFRGEGMASGIQDLAGSRAGGVIRAMPNTNVLFPRTAVPVLQGQLEPGEHWLACAVLGTTDEESWARAWPEVPVLNQLGIPLTETPPSAWHRGSTSIGHLR